MTELEEEERAGYKLSPRENTIQPTDNQRINQIIDDQVIAKALKILQTRLCRKDAMIDSPQTTKDYVVLQLAQKEHEVFCCLFLTNRNKVISWQEIFRGTINGASVYAREVVKEALACNAAAVIFVHNHPSGEPEPSTADKRITTRLKEALALVDISVIDHIVVGGTDTTSFAERGIL